MSAEPGGWGGWELVVSFPDQSPAFARGFEAGSIWQKMRDPHAPAEMELTTSVENREVIGRMAVADGWTYSVAPTDIVGWDETTLVKVRRPKLSNPHGLRIER